MKESSLNLYNNVRISCQLHTLKRQKESCLLEVRGIEEDLATLNQRKQTLTDGSCMIRVMKPHSSFVLQLFFIFNYNNDLIYLFFLFLFFQYSTNRTMSCPCWRGRRWKDSWTVPKQSCLLSSAVQERSWSPCKRYSIKVSLYKTKWKLQTIK